MKWQPEEVLAHRLSSSPALSALTAFYCRANEIEFPFGPGGQQNALKVPIGASICHKRPSLRVVLVPHSCSCDVMCHGGSRFHKIRVKLQQSSKSGQLFLSTSLSAWHSLSASTFCFYLHKTLR